MTDPFRTGALSAPTGTVTFFFTDIEGSTRLWGERPEAMGRALVRHDALLRRLIEARGGCVFKTIGDAFCAAFDVAPNAILCAVEIQRALDAEDWGELGTIRVRMALHTGAAEERDGDYFGQPLNRTARLLSTAAGGQILLSLATQELVQDNLPSGILLRDLGEHRLKDLVRPERIFQVLASGIQGEFPPLKSLESYPNNLPMQLTSFIGREREMEEVSRLLQDARLLTLTGPGGTGKTRLSLQVAAEHLDGFAQGVWFVELAPWSDPSLVPQAVASVLGVREQPGRPVQATLADQLREREMLLVLDNCEHLIDACRNLVHLLLRTCPRLRVIASSRETFGIAGEVVYSVPTLGLPPEPPERYLANGNGDTLSVVAESESVRLFVERAAAVQPAFSVTVENAPALAQVCRQLDGIPLAIELAAARVKALSVKEIAARLDNRFSLLTRGSRTALPRQQTLRALIDWSYDLLSEEERALLRRLAKFAGGWTLEAAEEVCGEDDAESEFPLPPGAVPIDRYEVLDYLTQLVDKSLVLVEEQAGRTRYRLLQTVRQYGRERLRECGEVRPLAHRHIHFFLKLAEEAAAGLAGPDPKPWLERLEVEHDNLRVALDNCALLGLAEQELRLAASLDVFWYTRGYLKEGLSRILAALSAPGAEARTSARARALDGAGLLSFRQGDHEAARRYNEESLEIAREVGDDKVAVRALVGLNYVALESKDYDRARALLEEALPLARKENGGINRRAALVLGNLGVVAHDQGDLDTSLRYCQDSLSVYEAMGDRAGGSWLLGFMGILAFKQGDYAASRRYYSRCLEIEASLDKKPTILACFRRFAALSVAEGQAERAARLFGAMENLCGELGISLSPTAREEYEAGLAAAREQLGEEAFTSACMEGRTLSLEAAIRFALEG